jgi:hypothetical protein
MWRADPRPPARRCARRSGGYVFAQMVVALGLLSTIVLLAQQSIVTVSSAEARLKVKRRATERATRTATEIARSVSASRHLFQDDDVGRAYLAALDLGGRPLLSRARLPRFDAAATMGPDQPGRPRTGNVLLYVEEAGPLLCVADATGGKRRRIDTVRFVCVYPHETTRSLVGKRKARDLVIWKSGLYADHAQILGVAVASERRAVVRELVQRFGCTYAWAASQPLETAFFAIDALGVVAASPDASLSLLEDPNASAGGRLVYGSWQLGRTDPAEPDYRPAFTADPPPVWAPDGFEVKVAGPSAARSVWFRLVVEHAAGNHVGVHTTSLLVAAGRR